MPNLGTDCNIDLPPPWPNLLVRLGLGRLGAVLGHGSDELTEQVVSIVGTRARFRMVLNRKHRQGPVAQPGDGFVVEVEMGDVHGPFGQGI